MTCSSDMQEQFAIIFWLGVLVSIAWGGIALLRWFLYEVM